VHGRINSDPLFATMAQWLCGKGSVCGEWVGIASEVNNSPAFGTLGGAKEEGSRSHNIVMTKVTVHVNQRPADQHASDLHQSQQAFLQ
jgi:hypothetical protein